jgi:hypothetical protein
MHLMHQDQRILVILIRLQGSHQILEINKNILSNI